MKSIYPIFAVIVAIALFYLYIDPAYAQLNVQRAQIKTVSDALGKTNKLILERDALIEKSSNIAQSDRDRLLKLLPDHVDNIRLVLDISKIAERHSMRVRNVALQAPQDFTAGLGGNQTNIESLVLSFSVSGTYETFRSFVFDLEKSLRIVDVEQLTITPSETGIYDYSINARTYWLKP